MAKDQNQAQMNVRIIIFSLFFLLSCSSIYFWLSGEPDVKIAMRLPGMDGAPLAAPEEVENVTIGEFFKRFDGKPEPDAGMWPRFRGVDCDGISKDDTPLHVDFSGNKPDVLWSVDLGEGHSGPAIFNGRVFLLDYDETRKADSLRCFSLKDGKEIWRRWYTVAIKRNHGISRTVPAVTDKYVVTMGPKCHVMCVETNTGKLLWTLDLKKDFNTDVPLWYTGQCPLIENDIAVLAPGGSYLLIGVDCKNGKIVWTTPNPRGWKMSHSSVTPAYIHGEKMYMYSAIGGTVGISAQKGSYGELLWETSEWSHNVLAPSPVLFSDNRIFLTAGYGSGSAVIKIRKDNDAYKVEILDVYKPDMGLALEQHTAILYKNHLFGILPNDAGGLRNRFVCYSPDDLKTPVWTSGGKERFGLGSFIVADDKFIIMNDNAALTFVDASTREFKKISEIELFKGRDAWAPLAIAGGKLVFRDSKRLVCVDLKK